MTANALSVAYFGIAILCGIILAARLVPWPADLLVLLLLGIGAVTIRRRLPTLGTGVGVGSALGLELLWLGCFAVTWLGLGLILNR